MLAVASVALVPWRAAALAADEKLSIQEVEWRLKRNFEVDQYYVSGNVDASLFADDCVFTDPTIKSVGAFHGQQSAHMHALSASHTTACAQVLDLCRLARLVLVMYCSGRIVCDHYCEPRCRQRQLRKGGSESLQSRNSARGPDLLQHPGRPYHRAHMAVRDAGALTMVSLGHSARR